MEYAHEGQKLALRRFLAKNIGLISQQLHEIMNCPDDCVARMQTPVLLVCARRPWSSQPCQYQYPKMLILSKTFVGLL